MPINVLLVGLHLGKGAFGGVSNYNRLLLENINSARLI